MNIRNPYSAPKTLKNNQNSNNEYYPFWENTLKMMAVGSLLYLIFLITHLSIEMYLEGGTMLWSILDSEAGIPSILLVVFLYIYCLLLYFSTGFTIAKIEQSKKVRLSVWLVVLIAILLYFLSTVGIELFGELFIEVYLGEENTMLEDTFSDINEMIIDIIIVSSVAVFLHKYLFKSPYLQSNTENDDLYFIGEEYPFWYNTLRMIVIAPFPCMIIFNIAMLFTPNLLNLEEIFSRGMLAIFFTYFAFIIGTYTITLIYNLPVGFIVATFEKKYKIALVSWFVFLVAIIWNILALIGNELLVKVIYHFYLNKEYEMFSYTSLQFYATIFSTIIYSIFAMLVHKFLFKNPFDEY